ncbi:hypothetical protein BDV95DRAFT_606761 [Massariosphaeria phaeospora]|uniref:Uncharacterized protein n=1 Tax=Massariosphaeria phaeospora TaxID=100035 RepID=A0A7C8IG65_9PLEO|nr:hypothetical protein BDV95DRAFT_606761 [Massariosphaeria phaeospora]
MPEPGLGSVALPKNSVARIIGLLLLSLVIPPLALYLDGATSLTILIDALFYFTLLWPISAAIAFGYILRSKKRRNMSRPARYRLWVQNPPGTAPHEAHNSATTPKPAELDSPPAPVPDLPMSLPVLENPMVLPAPKTTAPTLISEDPFKDPDKPLRDPLT